MHSPAGPDRAAAARELDYQLPESWSALMDSLRESHSGANTH